MGIRIISNETDTKAALYCSTSGFAFGPIIDCNTADSAYETADSFLQWCGSDARELSDQDLAYKWLQYRETHQAIQDPPG